jgi:sugar/nucleoside kinase (ribokinase family)
MPKVITIGSGVMDVFLLPQNTPEVHTKAFDTGSAMCFAIGGKYEASEIYFDTGGGATNSAATLKSLGIRTACFTYVGNDLNGEHVRSDLKKRKIDTSLVKIHKKLGTGYSSIMLFPNGERTIIVYRGASSVFDPKDVKLAGMKADWYYLTNVKGNMKFIDALFKAAQKHSASIMWNPGKAELKKGLTVLQKYFKKTHVLNMNLEESYIVTGMKTLEGAMKKLMEYSQIVIITDGKKGLYVGTEGEMYFVPSSGNAPVNTTGAGDAFGSGFLAGYIKYKNWQDACKVGVWSADGVVQEMGAKHGILEAFPSKKKMNRITIKKIS